jgi:phosphonate transport system permease protein
MSLALRKPWFKRLALHLCIWGALTAVSIWAMIRSEFNLQALVSAGPNFVEFFGRLTPPDWSVAQLVFESTVETLLITLAGTVVAIVVSLPLGFLAASNVSPAWIAHPVKWTLGLIRSIPLIVVALIFVSAVGLGPFPGALAIAFHSVGMLAKFYAEEFETAERGIIQAVSGTGGNWFQTLRFGLFPQCVPQVLSFTVYRFEMNFRDAAVLGLVGAGGIGYYIQLYVRGFQYEKVAVLLLVIIAVVTLLDQLTFWLRRRLH